MPFDMNAWEKERTDRIATSRAAGRIHLDETVVAVETLRGRRVECVHDAMETGTVVSASNDGDVVVLWADGYSEAKNSMGLQVSIDPRTRRMRGKESWLTPRDLKDYVLKDVRAGTHEAEWIMSNRAKARRRETATGA